MTKTALPIAPLFQASTIETLATLIAEGNAVKRWSSLVPIQPRGTRTPIFCVHGGSGTVLHFHPLAKRLGEDQPFYGFQMQGLYGDFPPDMTIEQMAAHYVREMLTVQAHGPYMLAGYCFGAIVAVEMGRLLEAQGESVSLLVSINGPSPSYIKRFGAPRRLKAPPPPRTVLPANTWVSRTVRAAKRVYWELEWAKVRLRWRRAWATYVWKLQNRTIDMATQAHVWLKRPLPDRWRQMAIYLICHHAERRYVPPTFGWPLLLFTAPELYRRDDLGWRPHATGAFEICPVPGQHVTQRDAMSEPLVEFVSERMQAAVEAATQAFPDTAPGVAQKSATPGAAASSTQAA